MQFKKVLTQDVFSRLSENWQLKIKMSLIPFYEM